MGEGGRIDRPLRDVGAIKLLPNKAAAVSQYIVRAAERNKREARGIFIYKKDFLSM